jgi:release factor glutamine methyltransferase
MTVLEVIQRGTDFLAARGVESPRLQVESLLAHTLQIPRLQLYLQFNRVLTEAQTEQARALVQRRSRREPLQHLIGSVVFCGLELEVRPGVLIPRPETELVAEHARSLLARISDPHPHLLDFGTGSGCLIIALLARCPNARAHAVDCSRAALDLAAANARRHAVDSRVIFSEGDGFQALPTGARFHLVVSNPPYVPTNIIATLEPEVRDHDPRGALDGGADGLDYYRRLASECRPWLHSDGWLVMELGDGQSDPVASLLVEHNWVVDDIERDYSGEPRVIRCRAGRT